MTTIMAEQDLFELTLFTRYSQMDILSGSQKPPLFGFRLALANTVLFIVYDLLVITGIVMGKGILIEPYLAIAEVMTLVAAPFLILLIVAIHAYAPQNAKIYSVVALVWITLMAGSTIIVHFVNLTLWRQISLQQRNDYIRFMGWEWPSMLYAIELVAWHLFFGLSVFFAAFVFKGRGKEKTVRLTLMTTGLFCIFGLIGPIVGDLTWRLIGVLGYAFGFPIACVMMAGVFKNLH